MKSTYLTLKLHYVSYILVAVSYVHTYSPLPSARRPNTYYSDPHNDLELNDHPHLDPVAPSDAASRVYIRISMLIVSVLFFMIERLWLFLKSSNPVECFIKLCRSGLWHHVATQTNKRGGSHSTLHLVSWRNEVRHYKPRRGFFNCSGLRAPLLPAPGTSLRLHMFPTNRGLIPFSRLIPLFGALLWPK